MCGLFGVIVGTRDVALCRKFIKAASFVNSTRGEDAFGIATYDKGDVVVAKAVGASFNLLTSPAIGHTIDDLGEVVIGHTRAGTQGGFSVAAAHPFEEENIVVAHNGTIRNKFELLPFAYRDKVQAESDSAFLAVALDMANGDIDEIKKLLEKISGSFAITWIDKVTGTVYMARNDQRPISYVKTTNNSLLWSSDADDLTWACNKAGLPVSKETNIIRLKENVIWNVTEDTIVKFEPTEAYGSYSRRGAWNNWEHNHYGNTGGSGKELSTTVSSEVKVGACGDMIMRSHIFDRVNRKIHITGMLQLGDKITVAATAEEDWPNSVSKREMKKRYKLGTKAPCSIRALVYKRAKVASVRVDFINTTRNYYECGGIIMPEDEVAEALSGGCTVCGKKLTLQDVTDNKVIWWSPGEYPLCPTCGETQGVSDV